MYNGYDFYLGDMKLPIAPPSLKITVGSKNKVVELINEGDINILASPGLIDVEFTARFPMRDYPYAKKVESFKSYYDKIKELKEGKKSFQFIVARQTPNGTVTWETNITMAMESFSIEENVDNGDDVLVAFKLKQYKPYATKTVKIENSNIIKPNGVPREDKDIVQTEYVIQSGDTLWGIAQKFYGDGSKWKIIYDANKEAIEADAVKHGRESSSTGHWIYPGLKLVIPGADALTSPSTGTTTSTGTVIPKYKMSISWESRVQNVHLVLKYVYDGKTKVYSLKPPSHATLEVDRGSVVEAAIAVTAASTVSDGAIQGVGSIMSGSKTPNYEVYASRMVGFVSLGTNKWAFPAVNKDGRLELDVRTSVTTCTLTVNVAQITDSTMATSSCTVSVGSSSHTIYPGKNKSISVPNGATVKVQPHVPKATAGKYYGWAIIKNNKTIQNTYRHDAEGASFTVNNDTSVSIRLQSGLVSVG